MNNEGSDYEEEVKTVSAHNENNKNNNYNVVSNLLGDDEFEENFFE